MNSDKYIATKGEKVYFDSFGGLMKGIYLERINDTKIRIKITNQHYYYDRIVEYSPTWIFPRKCFHKTGIFSYVIYPDYVFE